MTTFKTILITLAAIALVTLLFIYSGFYNMGADARHWSQMLVIGR